MISSIFGKTKPINYIIVLTFLSLFYLGANLLLFHKGYSAGQILEYILAIAILVFSFFVVDFIVKRNKITGANSFAILLYAMLIVTFPKVLMDTNGILCNFFLLLALRRLISIKSLKKIKPKVFDATLWVCVASLFYDLALLFLILVFIAIYIYEPKSIRNWLVPFVGFFTFFMIAWGVFILVSDQNFLRQHYSISLGLHSAYFLDWRNSAKLIVFVLIVFIAGIFTFIRMNNSGTGKIATIRLISIFFILTVLLKVLSASSGAYPTIIMFLPAVVFFTGYVEHIEKPNIREIVLVLSIVLPVIIFLLGSAMR